MPVPPGSQFAGYRVVRALGEGASGSVVLAQRESDGLAVALKALPLPDDEAQARFAAEVQAVRRLQHPDIVAVLDSGHSARAGWLVMELLGGCDLRRYTQRARLLPEPLVLDIGRRLALALAHAHQRGVVHRDIKPSNVMVDWSVRRITLTDFGLARLDDASRTRSGVIAGTPDYMAPELLAGAPASAASDLYALGALVFELFTGRRPHQAASLGDLLRQVATEPAPDLRMLRPNIPSPVAKAVAQALDAQPSRRPRDALALAQALQHAGAMVNASPT